MHEVLSGLSLGPDFVALFIPGCNSSPGSRAETLVPRSEEMLRSKKSRSQGQFLSLAELQPVKDFGKYKKKN